MTTSMAASNDPNVAGRGPQARRRHSIASVESESVLPNARPATGRRSSIGGGLGLPPSQNSAGDVTPTARPSMVSRRRHSDDEGGEILTQQEDTGWRPKAILLRWCSRILQNSLFSCLMTALTLFVLVGDDLRLLCFESDSDSTFNWLTVVCLSFFTIEIILASVTKEDYFLGFWFLCDIFASASLIFDLTVVSEAMMGYPSISIENFQTVQAQNAVEESEYARASRASRVGTRVARLLRVVRLVRLSRIMQCMHSILPKRWTRGSSGGTEPGESADVHEVQEESRVGRKLSERTTQRVIVIVLAMLFVVPQLNSGSDHKAMMSSSAQYGANLIFQAWQDYELAASAGDTVARLLLQLREDWESQLLTYIYYHNYHAYCDEHGDYGCADQWLHKLCWIGYVRNHQSHLVQDPLDVFEEAYVQSMANQSAEWDTTFSGTEDEESLAMYSVGGLPDEIKSALKRPWITRCTEDESRQHSTDSAEIVGVSLIPGLPCPRNQLRLQETTWYVPDVLKADFFKQHMEGQFVFVFDLRKLVEWEAILSMVQTAFVVLVLAVGALLFSRDADQLVLLPIERMINKVEIIRQDPLYAIRLADQQYAPQAGTRRSSELGFFPEDKKLKGVRSIRPTGKKAKRPMRQKKSASMETKILENAIIKLGSLLALGFGEAGSEIIGKNLDDDNDCVDALVPGSKVEAIYGWCGIRHFATTTDVLQENTMVFVNQVAEIVHRIVDEHLGAANKNVGEAFLLVWRIGLYERDVQSKVADLAVLSFIQVVAELNRDRQLAQYREHPALLARLPNFRVSLGFGLHLGWSIEGAIGSEFKIDASYLSPHVNIACHLEAATTEYGVIILMSEPLVRCCNVMFSRHFRPIDHVKLQGSKTSTRLFTVDLNIEVLPVESAMSEKRRRKVNHIQERQEREQVKVEILNEGYRVHEVFDSDKYVRRMRERFVLAFFQEFERGYLNYEAGEWDVAAQVLGKTKTMLWNSNAGRTTEDGPSCTLLDYMRGFNFEAPAGWPGWRELREK